MEPGSNFASLKTMNIAKVLGPKFEYALETTEFEDEEESKEQSSLALEISVLNEEPRVQ